MAFFNSAVGVLQTLVVALGAGLGIWGVINLLEGYGQDNPASKSQGTKQLMDMPFVNVGGQHKFILAAQDLLSKLHTDLMGFLRGDLPWGEGLYQVAAQVVVIAPVNGVAARPSKFNIRGLCGAAIGRDQQLPIRFGGITDIVNGSL